MRHLELGNSKRVALIDDEDFERANNYTWSLSKDLNRVVCFINSKYTHLGRFILNYDGPLDVDHANRNRLDNQKSNLRIATRSQNIANRPALSNNTSGMKGIYWNKDKSKWQAQLWHDGTNHSLGRFDNREEAISVWNKEAKRIFGEFAYQNKV